MSKIIACVTAVVLGLSAGGEAFARGGHGGHGGRGHSHRGHAHRGHHGHRGHHARHRNQRHGRHFAHRGWHHGRHWHRGFYGRRGGWGSWGRYGYGWWPYRYWVNRPSYTDPLYLGTSVFSAPSIDLDPVDDGSGAADEAGE